MCEFLINNKDHWSKSADQTDWTLKKIRFMGATVKKGDFIACREDNTYRDTGNFNPNFCIIRVPEMDIEEGRTYISEIHGNEGDTHLVEKCRFTIATTKQFQTISKKQFLSKVADKIESGILIMERDF